MATKNAYKMSTGSNSTTTRSFENVHAAKKLIQEKTLPAPPSEETVARLNAIGREYPFCAYIKQNNNLFML
jgi:hypothetical protein